MTCIIIEDQAPAQRILKKYIEDLGTLDLKATFSSAIQALEFLQTSQVELIFLDIHLPKISGIDFLKTLVHPPQIILTTAFSDYALEGYELNVADYLLKPFSFQRFVKAVSKVKSQHSSTNDAKSIRKDIFIKSGYELIKVAIADILFIRSDKDYTEIHFEGKKLLSAEPLRYWEDELDSQQFVRSHKSYIVNIHKIEKVVGNQLYLPLQNRVPIGRSYKDDFVKQVLK